MRMRTRRALAALPLALALAACAAPAENTGVASTSSGKPSASAPTDRRDAQLKFAQCMREHGVTMKDPEPNGAISIETRQGEEQKVNKAQQACKGFMDAAVGDSKGKPDQKMLDQLLKFAQCMREHGIDMKDPSPDGRVDIDIPRGTPEQKVHEVQQACKKFAPDGFPT
ncbi:hypothetical protein [Streptosporangium sp. NPDC000396]|uniref:hypothetical protein n=1 Tax=Streptosporangium sp. NPDC000396 TaxID=3366185 RepID=UPI003673AFC8